MPHLETMAEDDAAEETPNVPAGSQPGRAVPFGEEDERPSKSIPSEPADADVRGANSPTPGKLISKEREEEDATVVEPQTTTQSDAEAVEPQPTTLSDAEVIVNDLHDSVQAKHRNPQGLYDSSNAYALALRSLIRPTLTIARIAHTLTNLSIRNRNDLLIDRRVEWSSDSSAKSRPCCTSAIGWVYTSTDPPAA